MMVPPTPPRLGLAQAGGLICEQRHSHSEQRHSQKTEQSQE